MRDCLVEHSQLGLLLFYSSSIQGRVIDGDQLALHKRHVCHRCYGSRPQLTLVLQHAQTAPQAPSGLYVCSIAWHISMDAPSRKPNKPLSMSRSEELQQHFYDSMQSVKASEVYTSGNTSVDIDVSSNGVTGARKPFSKY